MTTKQYERLLVTARRDLRKAYRDREELDRTIAKLRQTVVSLGALCKEDSPLQEVKTWWSPLGKNLTEAVANAIAGSATPVGAKEIRNILEDLGYRFQSTNPLASIHSVIGRLIEQKEITKAVSLKAGLGTIPGAPRFWYGHSDPPLPWALFADVRFDPAKRAYVLKE